MGHFFYYNATVEFMGPEHLPYAILAVTVLAIGLIFPLVLLLYPMKWFQKLLNISHVNSLSLRACFQGNYRDKSDGGWECRYFSAVYPVFRIGTSLTHSLTCNDLFMLLVILMSLGVITVLQVFHPYKKQYNQYRTLDTLLIMSMIGAIVSIVLHKNGTTLVMKLAPTLRLTAAVACNFTPFFYFGTQINLKMARQILLSKEHKIQRRTGCYPAIDFPMKLPPLLLLLEIETSIKRIINNACQFIYKHKFIV